MSEAKLTFPLSNVLVYSSWWRLRSRVESVAWKPVCLSIIRRIRSRNMSQVQWRPCFFLKILLKVFLFRLLDGSASSPPSSSTGLLLAGIWSPVPRPLPEELDEAEDEKATGLLVTSDVMHRERVEEEAASTAELPLSSPRLELFSRPPPPMSPEPWVWRVWTLDDRKGLETYKLRGSLWDIGREESESERFMMSLREREREIWWLKVVIQTCSFSTGVL